MGKLTATLLVTIGVAYPKSRNQPTQTLRTGPESRPKQCRQPAGKMRMKECPLCGTPMRMRTRSPAAPGVDATVRQLREWICPECDYFEEAEAGEE